MVKDVLYREEIQRTCFLLETIGWAESQRFQILLLASAAYWTTGADTGSQEPRRQGEASGAGTYACTAVFLLPCCFAVQPAVQVQHTFARAGGRTILPSANQNHAGFSHQNKPEFRSRTGKCCGYSSRNAF